MSHKRVDIGALLLHLLVIYLAIIPRLSDGLIITSVLAGDKKFKTISFDSKFLKPLTFESDLPFPSEFRRHRTMRPPKFDIDINVPIRLPLEEEYPQEEYKKPVESDVFFQSGDIHEPSYGKKEGNTNYQSKGYPPKPTTYRDEYATASTNEKSTKVPASESKELGLLPALARSIKFRPQITIGDSAEQRQSNARSDANDVFAQGGRQTPLVGQESYQNYAQQPANYGENDPDFIPGGFVNLKLSGPSGGPKMTYEDQDREKWAQTLSQTAGAMPVPILNYHQLQNFYGGLGTFTNGLPDNRYVETSLKEKLLSGFGKLTDKFHIGR